MIKILKLVSAIIIIQVVLAVVVVYAYRMYKIDRFSNDRIPITARPIVSNNGVIVNEWVHWYQNNQIRWNTYRYVYYCKIRNDDSDEFWSENFIEDGPLVDFRNQFNFPNQFDFQVIQGWWAPVAIKPKIVRSGQGNKYNDYALQEGEFIYYVRVGVSK